MKGTHFVYALIKNKKAVYIGCTGDIHNRIMQHRLTKEFDSHIIIKTYKDKRSALIAENAIITFLTLFGDGDWYNAEDILISVTREFKIRS